MTTHSWIANRPAVGQSDLEQNGAARKNISQFRSRRSDWRNWTAARRAGHVDSPPQHAKNSRWPTTGSGKSRPTGGGFPSPARRRAPRCRQIASKPPECREKNVAASRRLGKLSSKVAKLPAGLHGQFSAPVAGSRPGECSLRHFGTDSTSEQQRFGNPLVGPTRRPCAWASFRRMLVAGC